MVTRSPDNSSLARPTGMTDRRWHIHDLPEPEVLAALGCVAARHGFLNHVLIRTIKTLRQMTIEEADRTYALWGNGQLRDFVERCAVERLGKDHPAVSDLRDMLDEVKRVTQQRNLAVHGLWARDMDSEETMLIDAGAASAQPTVAQLYRLADEILAVASAINHGRIENQGGFLDVALKALG